MILSKVTAPSVAAPNVDDLRTDAGDGWVQCIVPLTGRSGSVAVALKALDVPVVLDASGALLGVSSGNLHAHLMTDSAHIVWRWRV